MRHPRTRYTRLLGVVVLLWAAAGAPSGAQAQQEVEALEESDELPAVQNRLYRLDYEVAATFGVMPIDSYYKGVMVGGGFTWHWTNLWAFEAAGAYSFNIKTSLREKLEKNFGFNETRFAEILWYGMAGAHFKPIYGKLSLLNKTLVYGEVYLSLAGIVARMDGGRVTDEDPNGKPPRFGFGAAPGLGLRGFITRHISARFDFRYFLIYSAGEGHFPLSLTLSFAYNLRSDLW